MKPEKIEKEILTMIAIQIGAQPEEHFNVSANLNDLDLDSLDLIEFIMTIEEKFDIEIDESHEEKWTTIQDVVDYVVENH